MNPETLLPWSDPVTVRQYQGERTFRRALATAEFLDAWRRDPGPFRAVNVHLGAFHMDGTYEVFWILDAPGNTDPSSGKTKSLIGTGDAPAAIQPKGGASVSLSSNPDYAWLMQSTPEDEAAIAKQIAERATIIDAKNSGQFYALCRRAPGIRIVGMKVGKTNAAWVCSVVYSDPELFPRA